MACGSPILTPVTDAGTTVAMVECRGASCDRGKPENKKARLRSRALISKPRSMLSVSSGGRSELRHDAFQRLEGLLGKIGVEPRDLLRLRHEGLVGGLGEFSLHFERLVQRLHARQLLDERLGVFERLLAVVAIGAGDGLKAVLDRGC